MVFNNAGIQALVYSGISPFPVAVSGVLLDMVNNAIFFVENYTGNTLGTSNIPDKYKPAITDFATSNVLKLMAVQDLGVKSVSVGDMSTDNSNLMNIAKMLEEKAYIELKSLSKGVKFGKARG